MRQGCASINISNVTERIQLKTEEQVQEGGKKALFLLLLENTKWRMTPVEREDKEAPGPRIRRPQQLHRGFVSGLRCHVEALGLLEIKPKARIESLSPSWAARLRT